MKQRDLMRVLYRRSPGDHERIIRDYAAEEIKGTVKRRQNKRKLPASDYARRLLADGLRKEWI